MPKRGGGQHPSGSRFNDLQEYYEHDDRKPKKEHGTVRRVSFKNTHNNSMSALKGRMSEMAIRTRFEELDEDMGDLINERVGTRRKGSPIPKGKFGNSRRLMLNPFGWYQVNVSQGHHYSKDDILRSILAAISPEVFIPYFWRTEKNCVIFFVDDFATASRLQQFDRGLQMPNGQRIFIRTRSNCPYTTVDEIKEYKEKIKLAMADRYNANAKSLDLSRFHLDPKFKGIFIGLFRPHVMAAAIDVIVENIPELVALILNENGLTSLDGFKNIAQRLPNLQILHLANNKIPSLAHILSLRNVPIVELNLDRNPLRQRYKDKAMYISEVRRKFPKLQKLDGEPLSPEIRFELTDQDALPEPKASYLCEANFANVIREFLEQYFKLYDSDNRSPLMAAYHPDALFSLTVPPASQAGRLNNYWGFNRNLMRIGGPSSSENAIKYRLLKVGNLPIVATLTELPKTEHELQTFSVDLTLYIEGKMMIFTVCGIFKEIDISATNGGELRSFRRDFVVVPKGPGNFCIRNEILFVTSATNAQTKLYNRLRHASSANFNQSPSTSSSAMAVTAVSSGTSSGIQSRLEMQMNNDNITHISQPMPQSSGTMAGAQLDDNMKIQMVHALSAYSTMNVEWSRKCLEETNWNYNHAAHAFDILQKDQKIPAAAFIK